MRRFPSPSMATSPQASFGSEQRAWAKIAAWMSAGTTRMSDAGGRPGGRAGVVIIDEEGRPVRIAAGGTGRVAPDLDRLEVLFQGVVEQEPPAQRLSDAEQHLD